jgi:hypothetical protein
MLSLQGSCDVYEGGGRMSLDEQIKQESEIKRSEERAELIFAQVEEMAYLKRLGNQERARLDSLRTVPIASPGDMRCEFCGRHSRGRTVCLFCQAVQNDTY